MPKMGKLGTLTEEELTGVLAYAGLILVAFELIKSLIVKPIKSFYKNTTFADGLPFKSYEEDVRSRHKNEFEACLLYLRDFMEAIDSDDVLTIQELRRHRNELAHDLASRLQNLEIDRYVALLKEANKTLFKLSNYKTRMDIGADPVFRLMGVDLESVAGHEYLLFQEVLGKITVLRSKLQ